ncbi:hypothetical protein N658DRAFT_266896 [Parathielavia hyrcaniae]|uniref:Uncharacterized protein n=1 Tax=Parathielavia hyrcaniae TaxID=113614 RepID=A0AAN6SYN4_9PEZI|nr:hypothetical protein N658DRAFT_266896 [Parathielavia hyrcaniae]
MSQCVIIAWLHVLRALRQVQISLSLSARGHGDPEVSTFKGRRSTSQTVGAAARFLLASPVRKCELQFQQLAR